MEKKVYKICVWYDGQRFPELLKVMRRRGYDEEFDAFEEFRSMANSRLQSGCSISHITHQWNYHFVAPDGRGFCLYMFED